MQGFQKKKDVGLHSEILVENKLLKNLIKKKKENYKLNIVNDMKVKRKDQKVFWKLLEKLQEPKNDLFRNMISGKKWDDHFKTILRDDTREINYPQTSTEPGPLD